MEDSRYDKKGKTKFRSYLVINMRKLMPRHGMCKKVKFVLERITLSVSSLVLLIPDGIELLAGNWSGGLTGRPTARGLGAESHQYYVHLSENF